jgi:hypothetical protein
MARNLVSVYLNELIDFGGIPTPRHEAYRELIRTAESTGYPHPRRLADTWMAGYDSKHREASCTA